MKKVLFIIVLIVSTGLLSCEKKETTQIGTVSNMSDLKIPQGFTWENSTDIYFDISITDTRFGDAYILFPFLMPTLL